MSPTHEQPPTWHEIQEARKALSEAIAEMVLTPIPRWTRLRWRIMRRIRSKS